ncbi:nuclear transport factor 2 family protein [Mucilaginibacter sp. UYCu711]|uniref:nuclear transport factor 2 family protein n=1 Tax=Mucilaginibacter sp. UYCu711 TaxID=3156339 RepID=UPI003D1F78D6
MEQKSNKTTVAEFYKRIVGQRDSSLINQYVHEHYIPHSPMGRDGRESLFEMIEFLKTLPPPAETKSPVKRLIGDGELVIIQLDISFMGKRMVVIDLFRVADGLLAEHWDAVQEIAAENDLMTDGALIINSYADTDANQLLVSNFYRDVFENHDTRLLNSYLTTDYIEHNLAERLDDYYHHSIKVHRIICEGDFVVVQSEYLKDSQSFALYDILRIENEKIAEHWSVQQAIPDVMPHTNGML